MAAQFPPCPASLKAIQQYMRTASDYDQRDPVVSYWCRLYALQTGLKVDRSSHEAKVFLVSLMDWLETQKRSMADNEAITTDLAAQAYIEGCALKLFMYADSKDRAAVFGKDVVKAFFTAGLLYDVMTTFGELTEEVAQNRKYAKWKATYIHKCLRDGEQPQPGPMREEGEEDEEGPPLQPMPGPSGFGFIPPSGLSGIPDAPTNLPPPSNSYPPPANPYNPPPTPTQLPTTPEFPNVQKFPSGSLGENGDTATVMPSGGVQLTADQMTKAQKYCKWAGSALSYDDVPTAITNIKKALKLLETGIDS